MRIVATRTGSIETPGQAAVTVVAAVAIAVGAVRSGAPRPRHRAASSRNARIATTVAKPSNPSGGASQAIAKTADARTTPLRTRVTSLWRRATGSARRSDDRVSDIPGRPVAGVG